MAFEALRRIRGVVGMGLTWGVAWACVGALIGIFIDPNGAIDDMWVATLGLPGFLCGAVFAAVLGVAERRRHMGELTLPRVAGWGALAGLLLGMIPFAGGEPIAGTSRWLFGLMTIVPVTLLSAASAAATLALARRGRQIEAPPQKSIEGSG